MSLAQPSGSVPAPNTSSADSSAEGVRIENKSKFSFGRLISDVNLTLVTGIFYVFVSVIGLIYTWIFFYFFGINIFFYYNISDFVLSGLKWPILVAVCAVIPPVSYYLSSFLFDINHLVKFGLAVILIVIQIVTLSLLECNEFWHLPGILLASVATPVVAALGGWLTPYLSPWLSPGAPLRGHRVVATIAGVGSFITVGVVAVVWAIATARGYYVETARTFVFVAQQAEKQGGAANGNTEVERPLNDSDPWLVIGSTQAFVFFLEPRTGRVHGLPWTEIKRIEVECSAGEAPPPRSHDYGAALKIGNPQDCPDSIIRTWSVPDFQFLWPYGSSGAKPHGPQIPRHQDGVRQTAGEHLA